MLWGPDAGQGLGQPLPPTPCAQPWSDSSRPACKLSLPGPLSLESFSWMPAGQCWAESLPHLNSLLIPFLSPQLNLAPCGCGMSGEAQVGQLSCLPSSYTQGWMQRPKESRFALLALQSHLNPLAGWLSVNGNPSQGFKARVGTVEQGLGGWSRGWKQRGWGMDAVGSRSFRLTTFSSGSSPSSIPDRKGLITEG